MAPSSGEIDKTLVRTNKNIDGYVTSGDKHVSGSDRVTLVSSSRAVTSSRASFRRHE